MLIDLKQKQHTKQYRKTRRVKDKYKIVEIIYFKTHNLTIKNTGL